MRIINFLFPAINLQNKEKVKTMSIGLKILTIIYCVLQSIIYIVSTGKNSISFIGTFLGVYITCLELPLIAWAINRIVRHNLSFWEIANELWFIIVIQRYVSLITTSVYSLHIAMRIINIIGFIWMLINNSVILRKKLGFTYLQIAVIIIVYIFVTYGLFLSTLF